MRYIQSKTGNINSIRRVDALCGGALLHRADVTSDCRIKNVITASK